MIDKVLKDIKSLFKVQDKAKFVKQNIPYLAFFYLGNIFSHHVRVVCKGYQQERSYKRPPKINTENEKQNISKSKRGFLSTGNLSSFQLPDSFCFL